MSPITSCIRCGRRRWSTRGRWLASPPPSRCPPERGRASGSCAGICGPARRGHSRASGKQGRRLRPGRGPAHPPPADRLHAALLCVRASRHRPGPARRVPDGGMAAVVQHDGLWRLLAPEAELSRWPLRRPGGRDTQRCSPSRPARTNPGSSTACTSSATRLGPQTDPEFFAAASLQPVNSRHRGDLDRRRRPGNRRRCAAGPSPSPAGCPGRRPLGDGQRRPVPPPAMWRASDRHPPRPPPAWPARGRPQPAVPVGRGAAGGHRRASRELASVVAGLRRPAALDACVATPRPRWRVTPTTRSRMRCAACTALARRADPRQRQVAGTAPDRHAALRRRDRPRHRRRPPMSRSSRMCPPAPTSPVGCPSGPRSAAGPRETVVFEQIYLPLATAGQLLLNFAGPAPLLKRRQLVTMHDATPFRFLQTFRKTFVGFYAVMYGALGRYARHLVTVSHFSAGELGSVLRIPTRFTVAGCAADRLTGSLPRPDVPGIDGRFYLVVGTLATLQEPARARAGDRRLRSHGGRRRRRRQPAGVQRAPPRSHRAPSSPGISATPSWPGCTATPRRWCSPGTRGSACRRWRPRFWAARWSRRRPPHCRRSWPTPHCSSTPTDTTALLDRLGELEGNPALAARLRARAPRTPAVHLGGFGRAAS